MGKTINMNQQIWNGIVKKLDPAEVRFLTRGFRTKERDTINKMKAVLLSKITTRITQSQQLGGNDLSWRGVIEGLKHAKTIIEKY